MLPKRHKKAQGVWIHSTQVGWLAVYAAEEIALSRGTAFEPPGVAIGTGSSEGRAPSLYFDRKTSTWIYSVVEPGTGTMHELKKKLPLFVYKGGRMHKAPLSSKRIADARAVLLADVKRRGLSCDVGNEPVCGNENGTPSLENISEGGGVKSDSSSENN